MASSRNPYWRQNMAGLFLAEEGGKLREALIKCLSMCEASHTENIKGGPSMMFYVEPDPTTEETEDPEQGNTDTEEATEIP